MKKRGSCGLKQARYETSCRLLAARCLEVQNSFTYVGTVIRLPAPVSAVVSMICVAFPNSRKAANCSAKERPTSIDRAGRAANGNSKFCSSNIGQRRYLRNYSLTTTNVFV